MKRLSWALVIYTVLVILWGAWVRISHSGDGCGQSWPLCDGALFPKVSSSEVWIEYFHRVTSGLYGLFVAGLYLWIRKRFPPGSAQRTAGFATLVLTVIEAGLGAALVLKGLVGENATIYRLVVMSLHQVNSLLLVGSTVITALLVSENPDVRPHWKGLFLHKGFLFIFMIIPATGAWAALSNTLFPTQHLLQGLAEDFSSESPWILRLRILHPLLASALALFFTYYFWLKPYGQKLAIGFFMTFVVGLVTLVSLSPVALKLIHLTMAQGLWVLMVHYVMTSLLSTKR
jgi:cytochrome c oxidase assembly protein subunit 15